MAYIYLFILFLELLAFFSASPNLALLAVDSQVGLLRNGASEGLHLFILGSLNSIYPLCQWIAAPLVGALADRFSRRFVLILVAASNFVGYLLVGYGTYAISVPFVVLGLAIPAFSGGIFPIVKTALSDLSTKEKRKLWFNRVALVKAIATIGGPLFSLLIVTQNTLAPSFLCSACLSLISLILALFFIQDTRMMSKTPKPTMNDEKPSFAFFLFAAFFFLIAGWWTYVKFAPALLFERYQLDRSCFYFFLSALGLGNVFTQLILLKFPMRWFASLFPILALTLGLQMTSFPLGCIIVLFLGSVFLQGCLIPHTEALISCLGHAQNQGKIQGFVQSAESAGRILGPFIAGLLSLQYASFSLILASVFILLAFLSFQKLKQTEAIS
jgi:DHA1 family tetracycline resistance protein-like MFS transporter